MSNADSVRTKPVELKIGDEIYYLKYDFNAFIEIEDEYKSIEIAFKLMQGEDVLDATGQKIPLENDDGTLMLDDDGEQLYRKNIKLKVARFIVWAGLLHNNKDITLEDVGALMEFTNMNYIFKCVMSALTGSMPKKSKKEDNLKN